MLEYSRNEEGQLFGTRATSVEALSQEGKMCIIEVGASSAYDMCDSNALEPLCVWIGPPKVDAFRERLQGEGVMTNFEIDDTISVAQEETKLALTSGYFEKTIFADSFDNAYKELRQ